jgi:hypothetical protein
VTHTPCRQDLSTSSRHLAHSGGSSDSGVFTSGGVGHESNDGKKNTASPDLSRLTDPFESVKSPSEAFADINHLRHRSLELNQMAVGSLTFAARHVN